MVDIINRCGATAIIFTACSNLRDLTLEDNFNNTFSKKYYPCGLRYNPTDNVSKGSKYYGFKRKAEGFYWVFLYFITFVCVNKHNLYGFTFTNTCLS